MKSWRLCFRTRPRPEEIEREIEEELRFHIEMRTQENLAAGMSPEEAPMDALRRFGNYQQVKASCYELVKDKLANSRARKILNCLIWVMHGCGWTLRFSSEVEQIRQCGEVLIAISILWRLLLYLRLSLFVRKSARLHPEPSLVLEAPTSSESFHSPIPYYDQRGRTPVERILADHE